MTSSNGDAHHLWVRTPHGYRLVGPDWHMSRVLPRSVRYLFWSSNLAYWALAFAVAGGMIGGVAATDCLFPRACDNLFLQVLVTTGMAFVSTLFHGMQLRILGPPPSAGDDDGQAAGYLRRMRLFNLCDNACAAGAVLLTMACLPVRAMDGVFPIACFVSGFIYKHRRCYKLYALCHGAWHVATAWLVWVAFRRAVADAPRPPQQVCMGGVCKLLITE